MAPDVRVWRHQFVYGLVCGVLILSQLIAFDFFQRARAFGRCDVGFDFCLGDTQAKLHPDLAGGGGVFLCRYYAESSAGAVDIAGGFGC